MHDRIPGKVDVLRKAAPQMRGFLGGRIAVADAVRIVAPVGVLAMPVLPLMTPLALAAHDVVFDEDEIALLEALTPRELAPGLGDDADILVPHDHRRVR